MGGLLALKLAESHRVSGLVLLSPATPAALRRRPKAYELRLPARFRHELVGWDLPLDQLLQRNSDLTLADVQRIRHLMGAESGAARRDVLSGVPVARERLDSLPTLVIGAGLDRQYPEPETERLASWLRAEYLPFGAHSHYGLVVGENSYQQVADAIRSFLEVHKL